jgi:hypothetical protein
LQLSFPAVRSILFHCQVTFSSNVHHHFVYLYYISDVHPDTL